MSKLHGSNGPSPILEREHELAELKRSLGRARHGEGATIIVSGEHGSGRTTLLAEAQRLAARGRMMTLSATCSTQEREFSFGVVRQLFERARAGTPAQAGIAFADLDGLQSAIGRLAESTPILITVDDLEACDAGSLALLGQLSRRIFDQPLVLACTALAAASGGERGPLAAFVGGRGPRILELGDLSEAGTATLVAQRIGRPPEGPFAIACHLATGGNPWLIEELADAARAEGLSPDVDSAERLGGLAPATISRKLLSGLDARDQAFARAASVLGSGSELADVASLAAMPTADGGEVADSLVREGILAAESAIRFARPVVEAAVYADLPPHERGAAHARAARLLAERGRTDAVTAHVLAAQPAADAWVVARLEAAGEAALRAGEPGLARRCLVRALAEPPPAADRARLLFAAGLAASRASAPDAATLLTQALERADDPGVRPATVLELAQVLAYDGRPGRATALLVGTLDALDPDHPLRAELEALVLALATTSTSGRRIVDERQSPTSRQESLPASGSRPLQAALALRRVTAGGTATEAIALAQDALSGGRLTTGQGSASPLPLLAAVALVWADRTDLAREVADRALAISAARGSSIGRILALTTRALARFRSGDLAGAAADATDVLENEAGRGGQAFVVPALATLAEVLIEQGELAEADAALARMAVIAHDPDALLVQPLREARARLSMARSDPATALSELSGCEARETDLGAQTVVPVAWRSESAMACLALGRPADARRLAEQELSLARSFGAPRAIGVALRGSGLAGVAESKRRSRSLELLREAATVLARSGDRLELARTAIALGSALRRAGHRTESRERLTEGLEAARACGATMLVERGYAELAAGGTRQRKILRSGVSELTPSERRVAAMAAEGMTNREIAETLVITVKTVESHLGHAYRKLEIRSRKQLPRALTGQGLREPPPGSGSLGALPGG